MPAEAINPEGWAAPKGYNNGMILSGQRLLCVAGQIAWNAQQELVGKGDFPAQFRQALLNVLAVVEAGGGGAADIGKLTIYVTDKHAYLASIKDVGAAYRDVLGKNFPAMALVQVADLLEEGAMVEIEALAMLE
ncbi:MAG: RidA family protein [Planctomycetes bacterium]|nr:RidA family protein [Planctomycetota bacterium]